MAHEWQKIENASRNMKEWPLCLPHCYTSQVNYNPSEVEERRLEFDSVSSMEVDIMVKGRKVLPELENLQVW